MRSPRAQLLYEFGIEIATQLSHLTIIDKYQTSNVVMNTSALISDRNRPITIQSNSYDQVRMPRSSAQWLYQYSIIRHSVYGTGNCITCAAMVAGEYLEFLDQFGIQTLVEIICNHINPFVVVNRKGDLQNITQWGEDAFIIDVWHQNQFSNDFLPGVFWADDPNHPLIGIMRTERHRGFSGHSVLREGPEIRMMM